MHQANQIKTDADCVDCLVAFVLLAGTVTTAGFVTAWTLGVPLSAAAYVVIGVLGFFVADCVRGWWR